MIDEKNSNSNFLYNNNVKLNSYPKLSDIENARKILTEYGIGKTPLIKSETLSKFTGNRVYLKIESLQTTGTFKSRGAVYKIDKLIKDSQIKTTEKNYLSNNEKRNEKPLKSINNNSVEHDRLYNGVIAASAGNHAQGVAYAASRNNIPCTIVMPTNVHSSKIEATKSYGAKVILNGEDYDASLSYSKLISKEEKLYQVHAYDDYDIVSGQGTIGLEILEDMPDVDEIYIPIGGGGLASGISIAIKSKKPDVKIIGVESLAYPSMKESLTKGVIQSMNRGNTIADSISIKSPGNLTYKILKEYMDSIVLVDDDSIKNAIYILLEREKIVVEPAGAVGVAYLLESNRKSKTNDLSKDHDGKNLAIILSGGNVDMNLLSQIAAKNQ